MYSLYYSPGACSLAVHTLLNEIGAEFKLEKASIKDGETRTAEFLKLNPRGQVPVLVEDGKAMREGGAIIIYLCEKHNSSLLPKSGWERAQALQWLLFCNSTLHPAYSRAFWLMGLTNTGKETLLKAAADSISRIWQDVETQLQNQPYLCGKECTAADILLTVIANWSDHVPMPISIGPKTRELFARVIARPAFQKAMATEHVTYKAAMAA